MSRRTKLSDELRLRCETSKRFERLREIASEATDSGITTDIVEPYTYGSLRPEITRVSAKIGDRVLSVTNCQAFLLGDNEEVIGRLEILESIVETTS